MFLHLVLLEVFQQVYSQISGVFAVFALLQQGIDSHGVGRRFLLKCLKKLVCLQTQWQHPRIENDQASL
jgi:predicted DNA-binding ArsR family transcriptional regulator